MEEPAAAAEAEAHGPLVVAFGDSLFAGYGLAQNEGLAPALDRALEQAGVAAEVVNAGVSGDTSAAGLQRLAFTLDGQAREPALVIVGLGGNDMLRGVAPSQTRANLDAMLAALKRRGVPAMLSGMVAAPNMGADYAREFNAIYPELAKKYDVPLYAFTLDGVIGQPGLMLGDGVHPSARGVAVMAGRMAPVVKDALATQ
nr:arylesterase [Sphingomonas mesophila]